MVLLSVLFSASSICYSHPEFLIDKEHTQDSAEVMLYSKCSLICSSHWDSFSFLKQVL